MGFLTPVLKVLFGWVINAVMNEVKDAWQNKEIQSVAGDAVRYAEARFSGNEEKKDKALARLREDAKALGHSISKDVASEVIELAVERYIK